MTKPCIYKVPGSSHIWVCTTLRDDTKRDQWGQPMHDVTDYSGIGMTPAAAWSDWRVWAGRGSMRMAVSNG